MFMKKFNNSFFDIFYTLQISNGMKIIVTKHYSPEYRGFQVISSLIKTSHLTLPLKISSFQLWNSHPGGIIRGLELKKVLVKLDQIWAEKWSELSYLAHLCQPSLRNAFNFKNYISRRKMKVFDVKLFTWKSLYQRWIIFGLSIVIFFMNPI